MDSATDKSKEIEPQAAAPVLSDRYALSAVDLVVVSTFVFAYLLFYYLPLPSVGVWRDVSIGRAILTQSSLPTQPLQMPLAAATPYRATHWLADVSLALVDRAGGPEAISLAATLLAVGYLLFVYFILDRGPYPSLLKLAAVVLSMATLFLDWHGLSPALMSAVQLAIFLAPLAIFARWRQPNGAPSLWTWIVSPLAIIAWTNTHWTFIAGPFLVAAIACGVACDAFRESGKLSDTFQNRTVQAWAWLMQLCLFATLLNPWGFGVWSDAIAQISLPQDGSGPLVLFSALGAIVALLVIAFTYLLRCSRVEIYGGDVMLFVVAVGLAACNTHFVLTFVAIAIVVGLPLTVGMFSLSTDKAKVTASSADQEQRPLRFVFTMLALLAIWIGFALSPISAVVLGGTPRPLVKAVDDPPVGVVQYLNENQRPRFVFAPIVWSDWIGYAVSDSPDLFATSDFERLPQQAKFDYRRLVQGGGVWKRVLDRYAVDTLVVDKRTQAEFATQVLGDVDEQWQLAWESDRALVLQRRID